MAGIVICVLVMVVGCIPLVLVGRAAALRRRALRDWTPATARIVGVGDRTKMPLHVAMSRMRVTAVGLYEYADAAGRTRQGYVPLDGPVRLDEVVEVPIAYDPDNPDDSVERVPYPAGILPGMIAFAVVIGIIAVLMGFAITMRLG